MARNAFTLLELLVSLFVVGLLVALLLPAVQSARESARRLKCSSHLKQLSVAIHNYHSTHGTFPPGGPFSIHTHILPYIEQGAVFLTFDFSDDAVTGNPAARRVAIPTYVCPSDSGVNGPAAGPGAATSYVGNSGVPTVCSKGDGVFQNLVLKGPVRMVDVIDGLSNTAAVSEILVGDGSFQQLRTNWNLPLSFPASQCEAFSQVCVATTTSTLLGDTWFRGRPWTVGDAGITLYNHRLPPNQKSCFNGTLVQDGIYSASSLHPSGVNVAFGDGRVRFINENINPEIWQALGSRNGNEALP